MFSSWLKYQLRLYCLRGNPLTSFLPPLPTPFPSSLNLLVLAYEFDYTPFGPLVSAPPTSLPPCPFYVWLCQHLRAISRSLWPVTLRSTNTETPLWMRVRGELLGQVFGRNRARAVMSQRTANLRGKSFLQITSWLRVNYKPWRQLPSVQLAFHSLSFLLRVP